MQLSKDRIMAIGAYAQAHGRSSSEFSLKTIIRDGGIEQWADKAADVADVQLGMEKVKDQLEADAKMREAAAGKMLAIGHRQRYTEKILPCAEAQRGCDRRKRS